MRETARERGSDFDEKKLTDSLPPKEFQSATFAKCTFPRKRRFAESRERLRMTIVVALQGTRKGPKKPC
jgi:hypothetical protein